MATKRSFLRKTFKMGTGLLIGAALVFVALKFKEQIKAALGPKFSKFVD